MINQKTIEIREVQDSDGGDIAEIYNYFITDTIVTFEEAPLSSGEMIRRIKAIRAYYPYIVAVSENHVVGYAYGSPWKERAAYRRTVETTVYLHPEWTGRGIGSKLYRVLLEKLQDGDYHIAMGIIALPNKASIKLHEAFGFQKAGHFHEVGRKFHQWIDVGFWELVLNPVDG